MPYDPAAAPPLHVPKNYYITTGTTHTVSVGRARRLVVSAVSSGGSVTLTRVGGGDVVFDEAMLRAHMVGAAGETSFAAALEYEYQAFAATNCTGFLVAV